MPQPSAFAYYNEVDAFACAWLNELIARKVIADGVVDQRPIQEVDDRDLEGFTQCHFFAGIGVWSYALRLAGWPDDLPVWTGSCPCQPFSTSGKRKGFSDDRHLWPVWAPLIAIRRPPVVFGEQVASPDGLSWLDLVQADMEDQSYAFGSADLCAAGVGAPHIRQRLYWVADDDSQGFDRSRLLLHERRSQQDRVGTTRCCEVGELGDYHQQRLQRRSGSVLSVVAPPEGQSTGCSGFTRGFWSPADWIYCRDDKYRPVEPGTFPLAHGAPARVGRLRGYGNAIVAEVAATFIRAYIEARGGVK